MEKVASFEEFRKKAMSIGEDDSTMIAEIPVDQDAHAESSGKMEHYMFFQNLKTIKHNIEEILSMDPAKVDAMISDGHDWAEDHIATAKDDVQEVADWIRAGSEEDEITKTQLVAEPAEPEAEMDDDDDEESDDDLEASVD
jgi:hypothetical protein